MTIHVLVEGAFDQKLIERLLADSHQNQGFRVHAVQDRDARRPIARKCLLVSREPIVFIMDADTHDERRVRQQQRDLEDYLRWGGHEVPFQVIQFVPEIEVIFFEKTSPLERLLGRPLDMQSRIAGRFAPREILRSLYTGLGVRDRTDIPSRLNERDLDELRSHTTVADLREFVGHHAPMAHTEQL